MYVIIIIQTMLNVNIKYEYLLISIKINVRDISAGIKISPPTSERTLIASSIEATSIPLVILMASPAKNIADTPIKTPNKYSRVLKNLIMSDSFPNSEQSKPSTQEITLQIFLLEYLSHQY